MRVLLKLFHSKSFLSCFCSDLLQGLLHQEERVGPVALFPVLLEAAAVVGQKILFELSSITRNAYPR